MPCDRLRPRISATSVEELDAGTAKRRRILRLSCQSPVFPGNTRYRGTACSVPLPCPLILDAVILRTCLEKREVLRIPSSRHVAERVQCGGHCAGRLPAVARLLRERAGEDALEALGSVGPMARSGTGGFSRIICRRRRCAGRSRNTGSLWSAGSRSWRRRSRCRRAP